MGLIRTFDGQTNVFLGSVGLGATPNERLTVNGSISANNTIFGKSISSGNYLGTWKGDPLSSDQVIVESVDLKTTNISAGLILAADGKGGVEFVENTGVSNINNIEGNLTVTGNISAGGNLSASTINAATSFISGGIDLFDIFGAGGCAGGVGGAGTINKIPKFTTSSCIGDSLISELGTTITVNGNLSAKCNLNIDGDSTILGNLSVHGDMHYIDTNVTVTSALSVVNTGTGPALFVRQDGAEPIAHFIDKDGDDIVFADDGKLGIGTFNPDEKLTIVGNASASSNIFAKNNVYSGNKLFVFGESTSAGNYICNNSSGDTTFFNNGGERMTIENAGNVGIGTATPGDKLTVQGNISSSGSICLLNDGRIRLGDSNDLDIYHDGTNTRIENDTGDLIIENGGDDIKILAEDDVVIRDNDDSTNMAQFINGGAVELYHSGNKKLETTTDGINVTGTVTSDGHTIAGNLSSNGTGIFKSLSGEDSNCCNYFAGNVGIGTKVPEAPLHVNSSGGTLAQFHRSGTQLVTIGGSSNMGQIRFQHGSDCVSTGATTGGDYRIDTGGSVGAGDNMFYVCKGGNVGIGTTSPAEKLTVAGNISASGSLSAIGSDPNYFEGRVGINTTSPSTCLEIDGGTGVDSSGGTIVIRQKGNTFNDGIAITSSHANSHRIWKDSDSTLYIGSTVDPDAFAQTLAGNVGIGTTNPAEKLSVYGNISASGSLSGTSVSVTDTSRGFVSAGRDLADIFQVEPGGIDGSGTACKIPIWTDSDTIGNSILSATSTTATVQGNFCSCALSSINASCDNYFAGNVGIGTTNPSHKFHVKAEADGDYVARIGNTEATAGANYGLKIDGGSNASDVALEVSSLAGTHLFEVRGDGNVGIGTSTPSAPLHVTCNGDVSTVIIHRDGSDPGSSALVNRINFKTDFSSVESDVGKIDVCTNASSFRTDMDFFVKSTGGNICKGLTVHGSTNDGARVGIGNNVSDPTEALTVTGNITGSGNITTQCGTMCGKIVRGISCVVATKVDSQFVGNTAEVCITSGCQGCVRIGTSNAVAMTLSANSAGTPRVGIGTSTPDKTLVVRGTDAEVVIDDIDSTDTPRLRFRESGNTSGQVSTDSCNLRFFTQSSERMRLVNSTGNVGIGTTSPLGKLEVQSSSVIGSVNAGADELVLQNCGFTGMSILACSNAAGQILFGDENANVEGKIQYFHTDDSFRFSTNQTEAVRIDSSGCVGIGTTNPAEKLSVYGNISASGSICTAATTNGFMSAGRDLADIFSTTSTGGVDGSGTAGKLPVWADSNTLGDSPISSISNGISIGSNGLNITTGSTVDKIRSDASFLVLESDNVILRNCGGTEDYGKFQENGAVLLYHNNVQKFETTSAGITVNGSISSKGYCSDVNNNTFLGTNALVSITEGCCNIGIGTCALFANLTSNNNTAIGSQALRCNTTGAQNTAIGRNSGRDNTEGTQNTSVGANSFVCNTTGSFNANLGYNAGCSNTTGNYNTGIGYNANQDVTDADYNTAVGFYANRNTTTGNCNTALGGYALNTNTTGGNNVAIGMMSLCANETASNNVAIGKFALRNNTTANSNVAVGHSALCANTTATQNTAIGFAVLKANTGGCNTALGFCALHNNSNSTRNTAVGMKAGLSNTTGACNTIMGSEAFLLNTTGDKNVAIGQGSLYTTNGGAQNTTVGTSSMFYNTTGCFNTAVGKSALLCNTTGGNNVGIGLCTLACVETGCCNIAIGECTGHGVACVNGTIAIGHCALFTGPGSAATIAIGTFALKSLTTGAGNMTMGACSMCTATTACNNIGYGIQSQKNLTTGRYNTSFGFNTLAGNREGCYNTAIGYLAGNGVFNGNLMCNTYVGACAGYSNCDGSSNVAVGCGALFSGVSDDKNVAVGQGSLYTTNGGADNTAVGFKSLYSNTTGCYNTAAGLCALSNNTTAVWNTAVGYQAGLEITTGSQNTLLGPYAGQKTASGQQNTYLGFAAGRCNVCSSNVAIGYNAARCQNDGSTALTCAMSGIYIGDSVKGTQGEINSIVIGYDACSCGSNTVNIGNSCTTTTYLNGNVTFNCSLSTNCSGIFSSLSAENSSCNNYFAGNVGIGTNIPHPNAKLTVQRSDDQIRITDGTLGYDIGYDNTYFRLKNSAGDTHFVANWSTGNVGIGCAAPGTKLHVKGAVKITNNSTTHTGGLCVVDCANARPWRIYGTGPGGCQVIETSGTSNSIHFGSELGGAINIKTCDTTRMFISGGGHAIGIGSTNPTSTMMFADNCKLAFGNGSDLQIYHAGCHSYVDQTAAPLGDLYIRQMGANRDILIQADTDGNGAASNFIIIDGSQSAIRMKRQTKWDDNICATFGDGSDLCIFHNGTHNFVTAEGGNGSLYIRPGSGNTVQIEDKDGQDMITAAGAGAVNLYYNNSKKLETTNVGVCVTGHVCACGNGYFSCVIAGGYFEEKAANPSLAGYPTGTIVSIGESGDLIKSTVKNDRKVFGVTQNGVCQPIVLGAEPVLVTGDIRIGDYITTSNKPGHGMRATCILHGAVIAQAMEAGCGDSHLVKAMIRKM